MTSNPAKVHVQTSYTTLLNTRTHEMGGSDDRGLTAHMCHYIKVPSCRLAAQTSQIYGDKAISDKEWPLVYLILRVI